MTTVNPISASGLMVVEGRTDQHFLSHLCRRAAPDLAARIEYHDARGFQGVLDTITGFVNEDTLTTVGFIVDADDDPQEHWQQVLNRIADANGEIDLPTSLDTNGTIIPENPDIGNPRIGVWVMPDNVSNGELEDFVVQMVPVNDSVWPRAQGYINGIPQPRKFDDDKTTKAEVHAWLATRKFPGLAGLAVREGDLDANAPISQSFLAWLTRLFA